MGRRNNESDESKSHKAVSRNNESHYRRRVLQALGAGITAGVAGCPGQSDSGGKSTATPGDNDTATPGDNSEGTATPEKKLPQLDQEYVGVAFDSPQDTFEFNPMRFLDTPRFPIWELIYERNTFTEGIAPAGLGLEDKHWGIYEGWEISPDEVAITLKETGWTNGEPVTGEDLYLEARQSQLQSLTDPEKLQKRGPGGLFDAAEEVDWDGQTVYFRSPEHEYFGQLNDLHLRETLNSWPFWVQYNRFQYFPEMIQRLEDIAEDYSEPWSDEAQAEMTKVTDEYWNMKWGQDHVEQEGIITNGIFELVDWGENEWTLEPNPHHRNADKINWQRIRLETIAEERAQWAAINSEHADGMAGFGAPPHIVEEVEDRYEVPLWSGRRAQTLVLNHNREPFDQREVRQAIAHAIDRQHVADNTDRLRHEATEIPCGMHNWMLDNWLGDLQKDFNHYELNENRVTALMQEAGLERNKNDMWQTSDGEPLEVNILTSNDTPEMELTIASSLESFGITSQPEVTEGAVYGERVQAGEFDAAGAAAGYGRGNPGQHYSILFSMLFDIGRNLEGNVNYGYITDKELEPLVENTPIEWYEGPGIGRLQHTETEYLEDFLTIEAPPVGEWDGELQEYDLLHSAMNLNRVTDMDEYKKEIQKLAWLYHWELIDIPLYTWFDASAQKKEDWIIPETGHHSWQFDWNPFNMMHGGHIQADPEGRGDPL